MSRTLTAIVASCALGMTLLAAPPARASENLDLSYVSADAVAAVVLHPKQVLESPELELLPTEVVVGVGLDYLGIDLSDVDVAIGILGLGELATGQPGLGAVLHFAEPYDPEAVLATTQRIDGLDALKIRLRSVERAGRATVVVRLPSSDGARLAELYRVNQKDLSPVKQEDRATFVWKGHAVPLASRSQRVLEKLLTVDEVAELLALSPRTIYKWTTSRRIPFLRVGRRLRFSESDLKAWLDSKKQDFKARRPL